MLSDSVRINLLVRYNFAAVQSAALEFSQVATQAPQLMQEAAWDAASAVT
jgi:hypothetical protein